MNQNFTTSIKVENSAKEVFDAITNVRAWWSEGITGHTDKLNEEWLYHYQDVHRCKIKVAELIPYQKVVWLVIDNYFSFTKDKEEWVGNRMEFEIVEKDNLTTLTFTQVGLVPEYECYDICQNAWNTYIQKSLYGLITKGMGEPNSKETPRTEDEKALSENFTCTFFVDKTPKEVFDSINNVRGWWQGEIEGNTNQIDDEFDYKVEGIHFSKQKLIEVVENKRITWLVTDSELSFVQDKTEWTGTKIIFEITEINNKTQLRFTHVGLVPKFECYKDCSNAWEQLVQQSLFSLITTGEGKKVF